MNWKTILSEIQAHGLSQTQVAERLDRSQAWVSSVSQGKYIDLRWADGQAMLALLENLRNVSTVNPEKQPKTESAPHVECCSGDPRHGERRKPELRGPSERRKDEVA